MMPKQLVFAITMVCSIFLFTENSFGFDLGGALNSLSKEIEKGANELEKKINQEPTNQNGQSNFPSKTSQQAQRPNQKYISGRIIELSNGRISARCRYKTENILRSEQIRGTPDQVDQQCGELVAKWKKEGAQFNDLKQQRLVREAQEQKEAIEKQKEIASKSKDRDPRGKWGVRFNMIKSDLIASGFKQQDSISWSQFKDNKWTWVWTTEESYPERIFRSFGEYTNSGFDDLKNALKKYQLILEPTDAEQERFIMDRGQISYYYQNDKDDGNPKYIQLYTEKIGRLTSMGVAYLSTHYFKKTVTKPNNDRSKSLSDL